MRRSNLVVWSVAMSLTASWGSFASGAETVEDNYRLFCVQCHGTLGNGQGINQTAGGLAVEARDHTSSEQMSKLSDEVIAKAIAEGGLAVDKSSLMPAFATSLSAPEIDEIVVYLRKLCACKYTE